MNTVTKDDARKFEHNRIIAKTLTMETLNIVKENYMMITSG